MFLFTVCTYNFDTKALILCRDQAKFTTMMGPIQKIFIKIDMSNGFYFKKKNMCLMPSDLKKFLFHGYTSSYS